MPYNWQPHDGGPCPTDPEQPVRIKVRGGVVSDWPRADAVVWQYGTRIAELDYDPMPSGAEVIEWMPLPSRPARVKADSA